ncbi:MAG: DEAD/DEAH box helicase family protein [Lachnospiraceae bacterium]|nr:DEAD/DEAH box helicase family protein [Lachnospiraceae bacterium]
MNYSNIMKFKGTWRNYQARVLEHSEKYLKDGKIHIVAAPGSGKTTLGIELIARLSEPSLILAPSITIREQWEARIAEAFLNDGLNVSDYVSQDLKNPKVITISTYQALHSAMNHYKGILKEDETSSGGKISKKADTSFSDDASNEYNSEEVDYVGFDLVSEMKKNGIKVLCLDECHHLRTEWWKALEEFKSSLDEPKVISLTATPPYDSTPELWERYMSMCGEIDEEIAIPELVKEGSLCPHQDYVYFNYPTEEELAEIDKFKERSNEFCKKLENDDTFIQVVRSYKGNSKSVNEHNIKNTEKLQEILQDLIYDNPDMYETGEGYTESLENELKRAGLIEKRQVCLTINDNIEKLLMTSKGKCKSIKEVVASEYKGFGDNLRMLILTDYIRKEHEKALGTDEDVTALGVLPFFEQLRRESSSMNNLRLGVLCGTVVIIPAEAKDALINVVGDSGKITFSKAGNLDENDYLKVNAIGDAHFLTGAVTEIFTQGYIKVIIGTKSLLGEGWDSPCINSLILASFVGAFMLSNQMRGRAIRIFKPVPDKTSNIWHLVCLLPSKYGEVSGENSSDYKLLARRMDNFLGLSYEEDVIENGIERLSVIKTPLNEENVSLINSKMLELANQREVLRNRWKSALDKCEKLEVTEETAVSDNAVSKTEYKKSKKNAVLSGLGVAAGIGLSLTPLGAIGLGLSGFSAAYGLTKLPKLNKLKSPANRLKSVGEGIFTALSNNKLLEEKKAKVCVDEGKNNKKLIYLSSSSARDKLLFANCINQFFAPVDNQRYLLIKYGKKDDSDAFYSIPDIFARNKEGAEEFYNHIRSYIGPYELVYTRNEKGKKILDAAKERLYEQGSNRSSMNKRVR